MGGETLHTSTAPTAYYQAANAIERTPRIHKRFEKITPSQKTGVTKFLSLCTLLSKFNTKALPTDELHAAAGAEG
jgi:hypothetical protein